MNNFDHWGDDAHEAERIMREVSKGPKPSPFARLSSWACDPHLKFSPFGLFNLIMMVLFVGKVWGAVMAAAEHVR